MSVFKDHKISLNELLKFIPEDTLSHLSATTKVDYYSKVLHGRKMFYLLLFCIYDNDRLSQRSMQDTFNSSGFKTFFDLQEDEKITRSSISERLSKIDSEFFKKIYEEMYSMLSKSLSYNEIEKNNLIRVDSTSVSEATSKLNEGIQKKGKKMVKFSFSFDGQLPSGVDVLTSQQYNSEDIALPEAILKHVEKNKDHKNIYVIDRGLQSARSMREFDNQGLRFILRCKANRKFEKLEDLLSDDVIKEWDGWRVIKDDKVNIYTGIPTLSKNGNNYHKEELVETELRLVVIKNARENKEFWFLTNDFELSPKEVADYYKSRWDIEVFFRFLKQELNLSHLVSLNKNGIEVMVYMTMIAAMLLLIYKKENNIGYKTAKRRINMELREMITAILITFAGGDPRKVFKT